ncbi:cysteine-rich CWC family protein [Simplicispira psychrophila]|uniref:cysteine-rich CWC family protein n=1 Tax=Simplicispira psychrophila TaxID=80882 RepID=UPI0012EB8351|nr:cysteine-rich CWC family protein [Simplicispira psychrophila]
MQPLSTSPIDTAHCPLCGQANQCAMAQQLSPTQCWCMGSTIATDALAGIPEVERGQRCICLACAARQHVL